MTHARAPTADVLARLLLIESTAGQLGGPEEILAFVGRGLERVPGVTKALHVPPAGSLTVDRGVRRFPLRLGQRSHGELAVFLTDPDAFLPYAPFVSNLASMIAVVLEERRQRELSEAQQRELEARAKDALQTSEARLAHALELARAGHWEYDVGSDLFTFNDHFYRIFRTTAAEVGGYQMSSGDYARRFCHPEDIGIVGDEIRGLIDAPDASYQRQVEHRMRYADGEFGYLSVVFSIVKDASGRTVKTFGVAQDITDRKRAEEERQNLEERLRVSQKMDAIGRLAGGVAHDFNNLLSVILSFATFASEALPAADPVRGDLDEIRKAAEGAASLTRQLLAFGRKQVLEPTVLELNQVVSELEKMLRRVIGEDLDLELRLAPESHLVRADRGQLEQVLMNMVVNARDAMPSGGRITIETACVELDEDYAVRQPGVKAGSYVQLVVADTGCGMDQQAKEKIFEPFFTTKERGKGTGLGLSTVYGIVKQSGGHIRVDSEEGRGTTFTIQLPRELSAAAATPIARPTIRRRPAGTRTILVVEDEEALRKVATRILEGAGYAVLSAVDGAEALQTGLRHAGEIDLLLTDVVMPRMGGNTLAQELARTRPELRVIYMSGYTDDAILARGVLESGTRFVRKPFSPTELLREVAEALDTEHVEHAVRGVAQRAASRGREA